jgi:hypothetical protein
MNLAQAITGAVLALGGALAGFGPGRMTVRRTAILQPGRAGATPR